MPSTPCMLDEPDALRSCFARQRVVLIGDSTSRYEYEQLAHSLQGDEAMLSALPFNPLDVEVYYRIPPFGNESRLPAWALKQPPTPPGCRTQPTKSKWAGVMRYTHGLLRKHELCDCSPGPTLCCAGR